MELKHYFRLIKKRMWLIVVCIILSCGTTLTIQYFFSSPQYEASAELVVNQYAVDGSGEFGVDINSVNTSIMLIRTYRELIVTPTILTKVIDELPEFELTLADFKDILSVSSSDQSQIMTIIVTYDSYEEAARIVNTIAEVFSVEGESIMMAGNITVLPAAYEIDDPVSIETSLALLMIASFIVSLAFSVGLVLLLEHLDETVRQDDDVLTLFGLQKIGAIPKTKKRDYLLFKHKNSMRKRGDGPYAAHNS